MIDSSPPPRPHGSGDDSPLAYVVRGIALVVVLPFRLAWEVLTAIGRGLYRWVLAPTGRFLDRWLLRPLEWLWRHLVWIPLCWLGRGALWLWRTLVWLPLTWLWEGMVWLWHQVLWPPLRWCALGLAWLLRILVLVPLYYLVWIPLTWLVRVLTPPVIQVGRWLAVLAGWIFAAVSWAWWLAGRILWWCWALTLRPVWLAVRWVWQNLIAPVGHWIQDNILEPIRDVTREVLFTLGLRR